MISFYQLDKLAYSEAFAKEQTITDDKSIKHEVKLAQRPAAEQDHRRSSRTKSEQC